MYARFFSFNALWLVRSVAAGMGAGASHRNSPRRRRGVDPRVADESTRSCHYGENR